MKETIILAPGASGSELLRTLAKFGRNTMGYRVFSRVELAKYALMKSGISITEEFLTAKEEASVIYSFLNEIDYFKAASFTDAESLASAMTTMRLLIPEDEASELDGRLVSGEFPEKNAAILEVYERYIAKCNEEGRIDSVGIVRRAIDEADAITEADFFTLSEYPLTPLDDTLIAAISGDTFREISLVELCGRGEHDNEKAGLADASCTEGSGKGKAPSADITFTNGYGRINEVKDIINGIYRDGIPLDKCVIAASNPSAYAQVLYDLACSYGIPVTYGSGVPILDSNPARLLKLIYEWKTRGYYGIDGLKRILSSDAFDRRKFAGTLGIDGKLKRRDMEELAIMAGSIRLSFDDMENRNRLRALKLTLDKEAAAARADRSPDTNATATQAADGTDSPAAGTAATDKAVKRTEYRLKVYSWTEKLADELASGFARFLSKYALIRAGAAGRVAGSSGRIDQSAIDVIIEMMDAYSRYAPDGDINEIIPQILGKTVCSENSREGCLHITSIAGAMACMRENLYVCGLSASEFPGSPSENYLLLDSDMMLLTDAEHAPTSENRIRRNVQALDDLLDLAAALGVKTHLSYAGYSLSELKEQNPSSVLYSIFERTGQRPDMNAFRAAVRQAAYFDSGIAADRLVGDAYSRGASIECKGWYEPMGDAGSAFDRAWSPSALSNYLQCPRRFYLLNILGIPEEESDDPFQVLSPAMTGTLAHTMMESLAEENLSRTDFLKASARAFDEALSKRPPIHFSDAEALKRNFLKMMETSFDMEPGNQVVSAEEEYNFTHPSGIRIHGYPDRVERGADGSFLIADFKTKGKIEHVQDDFSTCMQVVVYAWLCEQAGIDISSCEYRYLRKGRTVTCRYDDGMKEQLDAFLTGLKEAIDTNSFPRIENVDNCKYCRMADICNWPEEQAGEEAATDE